MGNWIGIGAGGIEAGGLAAAQTAAMTGNRVVAVFAPLLAAGAAVVATITAVATGMLLKNARAPAHPDGLKHGVAAVVHQLHHLGVMITRVQDCTDT